MGSWVDLVESLYYDLKHEDQLGRVSYLLISLEDSLEFSIEIMVRGLERGHGQGGREYLGEVKGQVRQ